MLTREDRIHLVELAAAAREAARRPYPWWEKHEVPHRDEIIARQLRRLAGQEAYVLVAEGAEWEGKVPAGWRRVHVAATDPVPVDPGTGVWVSYNKLYTRLKLSRLLSVLTLAEAEECGVAP